MAWAIVQKICEPFLPELIGLQPDSWRISNGKREPQTDGKQDVQLAGTSHTVSIRLPSVPTKARILRS